MEPKPKEREANGEKPQQRKPTWQEYQAAKASDFVTCLWCNHAISDSEFCPACHRRRCPNCGDG